MKKAIALLLMLSMLLTLCACGSSAPAAGGQSGSGAQSVGESEAQPEAESEKTFIEKKETLLTRRMEEGIPDYMFDETGPLLHEGQKITEYSYDEYGAPSGESVRYVDSETADYLKHMDYSDSEVVLDDAGEVLSITEPDDMSYTDFSVTATAMFEDGRVVKIERIHDQSGELAEEVEREFYPNGALKRETIRTRIIPLFRGGVYKAQTPMESVREYREDGRCAQMHTTDFSEDYKEEYTVDAKWEYDGTGDAVHLDYERSDGYAYSLDIQYDDAHRIVSGSKAYHGVYNDEVMEFAFRYDGDGRLVAADRRSGDTVLNSSYEYDENGFLTADRGVKADGTRDDVLYTWEKDDYGWYNGTISPRGGRRVFVSSSETMFSDKTDERGNLITDYAYSVEPSLMTLEPVFIEREVQNEYERRDILVEADPEELAQAEAAAETQEESEPQAAVSPEDYYPELAAAYCGVAVPTPSGQERLMRIVVEDMDQYHVHVVTEFHYDEGGKLTEIVDSFDPVGSYNQYWTAMKADEQGRLSEYWPSESWGITYVYGDDPDSYTMIRHYGDTSQEQVIRLENELLSTWIKKPAEELMQRFNPTIGEDGLVLKTETRYADGSVTESNYEYSAETYDGGALKAVLRRQTEYDDFSYPIMEFDEDGYLTCYNITGSRHVYYYYDYI